MCNRSKKLSLNINPKYDELNGYWVVFVEGKIFPRDVREAYSGSPKDKAKIINQALEDRARMAQYGNKRRTYNNYY